MVGSFFSPSNNCTPDGGVVALRGAPWRVVVGIKCARMRWVYKSVCRSLQMSKLSANDVLAAVKIAVTEVMGAIQFGPSESESYEFNGSTYDGFVYQLSSIPGLKIVGHSAARSIKMRGYVNVPFDVQQYHGPPYQYPDASQYARIQICNEQGRELFRVSERSQQGMIDALKSVFARSTPPASVSPEPTWPSQVQLVDVVDTALKKVLGEGIYIPRVESVEYKSNGRTYHALKYKVGMFRGLKIQGQDSADTIQMRPHITSHHSPPQLPCIVICDAEGKALVTLCEHTKELLLENLILLLDKENLPDDSVTAAPQKVPGRRTRRAQQQQAWATFADQVEQALDGLQPPPGDADTAASDQPVLEIMRACVRLLKLKAGGRGGR
jgi:hypothetical protein